jgi:GNAT superfamily N-acetyltransferase
VVTQLWTIRTATAGDAAFLESMLVETVNWLPDRHWSRDRVMADPNLAHYVEEWPRPTDLGVIAVDDKDQPVGAAWLRVFDATDPGYGFAGIDVPELGIAVTTAWRGKGIGRALLRTIHEQARRTGIATISLSVERANPAMRLYASVGYRTVASGPQSDTMTLALQSHRSAEQ